MCKPYIHIILKTGNVVELFEDDFGDDTSLTVKGHFHAIQEMYNEGSKVMYKSGNVWLDIMQISCMLYSNKN